VGVSDRASFLPSDFFNTIPAIADAIILKSMIPDWNDERSSVILQNCRQAHPESGSLLLVERIMPESPTVEDEDRSHAISDLNMLRCPGGLERTEKAYRHLLNDNGFRPTSILPARRFSVIEASVR
jgi:O-methyltransferase domain